MLTRGRMPGTPLGAVVGKELRIWWRSPEIRSSIWFGIIAGIPQLAGLAGIAVALMVRHSGSSSLRRAPEPCGRTFLGVRSVALWLILTLVGPTVAVAVLLAFGGPDRPAWLVLAALAVAVVNGLGAAWMCGAAAARRLETHLPETFARLRYPGTAATKGRGGLLGYLSGQAESSALAAAAAAKGEKPAPRKKETVG